MIPEKIKAATRMEIARLENILSDEYRNQKELNSEIKIIQGSLKATRGRIVRIIKEISEMKDFLTKDKD